MARGAAVALSQKALLLLVLPREYQVTLVVNNSEDTSKIAAILANCLSYVNHCG